MNTLRHFGLVPAAAALLLALMIVAALGAPLIAPYAETAVLGDPWDGISAAHWLGTDNLGRDMLTRLLYGTRTTLLIGLAATLIAVVLGVGAGFTAAIAGGWTDQVLSRLVDVLMSIPTLIFALVVLTVLGTSVPLVIGVIAVLDSTRVFRLARAVSVDVMAMEFIETARLRGESLWWFITREILPNTGPALLAEFGLRFSFACLFLSALSFLGLGVQPPQADLGGMVKDNVNAISFGLMVPLYPAIAIACITVSVNLMADVFVRRSSA